VSPAPAARRSQRIAAGTAPPTHLQELYNFHITLKKAVRQFGDVAVDAIRAELSQLLSKNTFTPLHRSTIPRAKQRSIIRSSIFLKEKFDASGVFTKLKARLVANGAQQDRDLFDNISSPTVSLSSLLIMLTIAAREGRIATTFDIGNAYLNAPMDDVNNEEVIMVIDSFLANILATLAPDVQPYLAPTGELTVRLNRALYGCLQSARLWYERLRDVLLLDGYTQNEHDPCVFNKMVDGHQCTLLIYVDDILCLCVSPTAAADLNAHLTHHFGEVKQHAGKMHSYLGMSLDFSNDGQVIVDMRAYVSSVLSDFKVSSTAPSPATANLFLIDANSPLLCEKDRSVFHTCVAKLLYLSKRARTDIQLPVAFLCTRATKATEEDNNKLFRVLNYLNKTKDLVLTLRCSEDLILRAFIDASFGCHADGKSHTGVVVTLGDAVVFTKSTKQHIVTKSSTEAELVALTDQTPTVLTLLRFLMLQGYELPPLVVHQDNLSTIAIVKKNTPEFRSRYIKIRYFFLLELQESGEIIIQYLPTADMLADIFTKPLQGRLFVSLRVRLLML